MPNNLRWASMAGSPKYSCRPGGKEKQLSVQVDGVGAVSGSLQQLEFQAAEGVLEAPPCPVPSLNHVEYLMGWASLGSCRSPGRPHGCSLSRGENPYQPVWRNLQGTGVKASLWLSVKASHSRDLLISIRNLSHLHDLS